MCGDLIDFPREARDHFRHESAKSALNKGSSPTSEAEKSRNFGDGDGKGAQINSILNIDSDHQVASAREKEVGAESGLLLQAGTRMLDGQGGTCPTQFSCSTRPNSLCLSRRHFCSTSTRDLSAPSSRSAFPSLPSSRARHP